MAEKTTCVIVGGGPAGMMMGLILARTGVEVTVLEKHADFLRDFRGDTVHPSTLRLLDELGLFARFDALPQSKIEKMEFESGGRGITVVDFRRLRQPHPYVAMVPQWDLLDLIAEAARAEPTFTLHMRTEVTELLRDGDKVVGVGYDGPQGKGELWADLTVGCDGRWSVVRREAGLATHEYPVPFDVWWFRVPRTVSGQYSLIPRTAPGRLLLMIPRQGYFQIAYLIPKGSDAHLRSRGIEAFHRDLAEMVPGVDLSALRSWDDVKHLDVHLNRLSQWYRSGVLCIGDAAHAMSPAGGVGINVAVQDAVGAARLLAEPLRGHRLTDADLKAVQRRRRLPVAVTQTFQKIMHRQLLAPVLAGGELKPPDGLLRLLARLPWLTRVPAYLIGTGVRSERLPAAACRNMMG